MNLCKICGKDSQASTCSIEHGMMWRFLKNKNVTQLDIRDIINVKTESSIKIKYILWERGINEHPTCKVCGVKLGDKKLLLDVKTSSTCSPICYKYVKEKITNEKITPVVCGVCGGINCSSRKCSCLKRELKFHNIDLNELKNQYPGYPINLSYKLFLNNLTDLPRCKYCGEEHSKVKNFIFQDCCSARCANVYKYNKLSWDKIKQHYELTLGVPSDFINSIDMYELAGVYNNKKRKIQKCGCGEWYVDACSYGCCNRQHFSNLQDLNKSTFSNFIVDGLFDVRQAVDYFNCSETFIRRYKIKFGIKEPCRNTIEEELRVLVGECKRNDRTLIYPKEIDILCNGFGIEYNGLMWHSEGNSRFTMFNQKDFSNKHLNKTELCEERGVQLFHIFENEWVDDTKKLIWESIINNKLNKSERIYARNCIIKIPTSLESDIFLTENHLQGMCDGSIRLGLFYNNELVSLMVFKRIENNEGVDYELLRFCSKINCCVVGAGSKLFKHFEVNFSPRGVITYVDRRWSQGELYSFLGFEFISNTEPNSFYFNNIRHIFSENDFKKVELPKIINLFDFRLGERENIFNIGYRVIYDCGNKIYIKKYK